MDYGITLVPTIWLERVYPKDLGQQTLKPKYPSQYDVVAKDCFGNIKGRWPWYYSNKPDRRYKHVTLNCHKHNVIWLN